MYPGNIPSSIPTKNTTGNSSPLALCKVINVTDSSVSSTLSKSLDNVIPSKKSLNPLSADSSSNSTATFKNSSKFAILFSASIVFSFSSAFVYPVSCNIFLISSEIVNSSFLAVIFSIQSINSLEFKKTLFSPYTSAFFIISYIDTLFCSAIIAILSKLVLPIPLLGSFIILFKLKLSA